MAGGAGRRRPSPTAMAATSRRRGQAHGDAETLVPTVKAPNEKIGRNAPCWCGSGKKFKLCHGAA